MPEYLAPGVYVEETSFRSKSIEGVSTTTTGFVGPTRYGPVDIEPDIITSLGEFERVYGDGQQLRFTGKDGSFEEMHNYMWHAVRSFFEEGGKRLYISRIFTPIYERDNEGKRTRIKEEGYAHSWMRSSNSAQDADSIRVRARFPGKLGEMRVRLTLKKGQNIVGSAAKTLSEGDVVWIERWACASPPASPLEEYGAFYIAESYADAATKETKWRFKAYYDGVLSPPGQVELSALSDVDPRCADKLCVVTATVAVMGGEDFQPVVYEGLPLHPGHKSRAGEPDSLFDRFASRPASLDLERRLPVVIELGRDENTGKSNIQDGIGVLSLLDAYSKAAAPLASPPYPGICAKLSDDKSADPDRSIELILEGGCDGERPSAAEYEGTVDVKDRKTGLKAFEDIEDISIVAAPGSTFKYENGYGSDAAAIIGKLISHAENMRYRIAVLDSADDQTISGVRAMRARYDSRHAALYYPWVRVNDPVTRTEICLPPSGFVAGIYARNDIERAVYKAPANEVVRGAIGFETTLNKSQQEVLNPEGINCFRFFEGRGYRLWGARTISSDPEWKYVNIRRYFAYLERSIDKGTQWAVFEPNGEALWANVKRTIEDFLFNEYQMGALLGDKPDKAYFVKCDRSTMTQNDLDNGRLVCLIGVAPLRPAEFVIFRIGQWTADRKS